MKGKFAFTKGRTIGFICCTLLPLLAIGLGLRLLTRDVVFNWGIGFGFFLIPLIVIGLLARCILSDYQTWKKTVLSGVILVLFLILFFVCVAFTAITQVKSYVGADAKEQYTAAIEGNSPMPDLSEIGQIKDLKLHSIYYSWLIFESETNYLIGSYDADEYEKQKEALDEKYVFQTEAIKDFLPHASPCTCEPAADIEGYHFRLLSVEEYKEELDYPKKLVLIGCSDEDREIVYLAFYDIDLDVIRSLHDFIMNDCGWKYIR